MTGRLVETVFKTMVVLMGITLATILVPVLDGRVFPVATFTAHTQFRMTPTRMQFAGVLDKRRNCTYLGTSAMLYNPGEVVGHELRLVYPPRPTDESHTRPAAKQWVEGWQVYTVYGTTIKRNARVFYFSRHKCYGKWLWTTYSTVGSINIVR